MSQLIYPYLSYADAPKAITWLCEDLGFELIRRQNGENSKVMHCELKLGESVIMLSSDDDTYDTLSLKQHSVGQGLYLLVEDVDVLFDKAVKSGAKVVFPPEDTEWKTRRCRIIDFEGYEWSFGTYQPGASW